MKFKPTRLQRIQLRKALKLNSKLIQKIIVGGVLLGLLVAIGTATKIDIEHGLTMTWASWPHLINGNLSWPDNLKFIA